MNRCKRIHFPYSVVYIVKITSKMVCNQVMYQLRVCNCYMLVA